MANIKIEQFPVIAVGPYSTEVPFNYSLYCAEATITSNDVLEPVIALGTPKEFRPKVGAQVIYRLIGDGSHIPTFSAAFDRTFDSFNYNYALGVINLVRFEFDGTAFRYSITPDVIGYEFPRQVGNFDLGNDLMVVTGHSPLTALIRVDTPVDAARVSAYNIIKSIHYTGTKPIVYSLSKDGAVWVTGRDPKLTQLVYTCAEVGPRLVYVKVGDGTLESAFVILICSVDDPEGIC